METPTVRATPREPAEGRAALIGGGGWKPQAIDDEWVADINKRGFDGKKLLQTARDLIAKHSKG